jgi:hypothetical protein
MVQVVEHLPSKCQALRSTPVSPKKKKNKNQVDASWWTNFIDSIASDWYNRFCRFCNLVFYVFLSTSKSLYFCYGNVVILTFKKFETFISWDKGQWHNLGKNTKQLHSLILDRPSSHKSQWAKVAPFAPVLELCPREMYTPEMTG